MKQGDRVRVYWPGGGITDNVEVIKPCTNTVQVKYHHNIIRIPCDWCEPAEPEIEEGRLVYYEDEKGEVQSGRYNRFVFQNSGYVVLEPVHYRWEELERWQIEHLHRCGLDKDDYKVIYGYITSEEHP